MGSRSVDPAGSASPRRDGAVARLRTATATSAGGIVVRYEDGRPQLVIGSRRERDGGPGRCPRARPNAARSTEETALREVAEETGLEVRITGPLQDIEYWFVQSGRRIHKTVHYFLMEPVGGDLTATTTSSTRSAGSRSTRRRDPDLRDRARPRRPGGRRPPVRRGRSRGRSGTTGGDLVTDAASRPAVHETPLADRHADLGARMIDFAGLADAGPVRLDPRGAPAVRERVGLFDLSHMGELLVEGPTPAPALAAAVVTIRRRSPSGARTTR